MIYGRRDGRWLGHLGFCADNLSDVSGFTTSYSFEIVSLVIRPGTMRSEDKDENGTISTKHNSSLVIPSVIVMTMRRFLTCAYGRGHGELHGGRHGGGQGGWYRGRHGGRHRGRQGCRHGVGKLCPNFFDLKLTTLQGVHGTLYCTLGLIVTELYCTRL